MTRIRTLQFVYTRAEKNLSVAKPPFSGFQFVAASPLLTESQMNRLESLATRDGSKSEQFWRKISPQTVRPTMWSYIDFPPNSVLIMRSETLQDENYLDQHGRWIPIVHGLLIEKSEFAKIGANPFRLIDSEQDAFIRDVQGLIENKPCIREFDSIQIEAAPEWESPVEGEWDLESLKCLLDPAYADHRPICLYGGAESIDHFLRYFFSRVTPWTRRHAFFSYAPGAIVPDNTMFVASETNCKLISLDVNRYQVSLPNPRPAQEKKSVFLDRVLLEKLAPNYQTATFDEYSSLVPTLAAFERLYNKGTALEAESVDENLLKEFCQKARRELFDHFVSSLQPGFSHGLRVSLANFVLSTTSAPTELLNIVYRASKNEQLFSEMLALWLNVCARFADELCSATDWKLMNQLAKQLGNWELSFGCTISANAGKQSMENLDRLDDSAFRRCFHAWSFRGIKHFFHTRHIETLAQLVPPFAWSDQQLLSLAKLLYAQRMDFSECALRQLRLRLMYCEPKMLARMTRYSDAIASLAADSRRSVT